MTKDRKIKVLVVEDSRSIQMHLVQLLNGDPRIEVIGTAGNGVEAIDFLQRQVPDVVLMDIEMPQMDGFEATRRIMESNPLPIVICAGSTNPREGISSFRLMEAGAVALVEKPVGKHNKDYEIAASHLCQTVRLMAEVRVVRRWPRRESAHPGASAPRKAASKIRMVGIGASTGGPVVLQTILSALPKDFALPILIVQHIAPGFVQGLVDWLNQTTGLKAHVAAHGTRPIPGHAYFAPDDFHLIVRPNGELELSKEPPDAGLRPSVARLFHSLADVCGQNAVGVLLTGMGRDGADGLKRMKEVGALTIAQDRETSAVHGMPGEAIALGAATYVLPPDQIASALSAQSDRMISGGKK